MEASFLNKNNISLTLNIVLTSLAIADVSTLHKLVELFFVLLVYYLLERFKAHVEFFGGETTI